MCGNKPCKTCAARAASGRSCDTRTAVRTAPSAMPAGAVGLENAFAVCNVAVSTALRSLPDDATTRLMRVFMLANCMKHPVADAAGTRDRGTVSAVQAQPNLTWYGSRK